MMFDRHIMRRNTNEGARYLWSRCHGGQGAYLRVLGNLNKLAVRIY